MLGASIVSATSRQKLHITALSSGSRLILLRSSSPYKKVCTASFGPGSPHDRHFLPSRSTTMRRICTLMAGKVAGSISLSRARRSCSCF